MVTIIPAACIVIYLFSIARDPRGAIDGARGIFDWLSPSIEALRALGMTGRFPGFVDGRPQLVYAPWWTVLTAIYLHGGLLHIFFNLLWIRQLGPQVEDAFGPARYFIIYSVAGAAGFVLSNVLAGAPTVGASGAVFGLLAAMIVYGRKVGGHFGSLMTRDLWQWAIVLFVLGFIMRNGVNNIAHLGGFAGGWIVASAMGHQRARRESRGVVAVAVSLLLATLYGFTNVAIDLARAFLRSS
jgi:rhomboid protease GluP